MLKAGTNGHWRPITSWPLVSLSSSQKYQVKVTCTPLPIYQTKIGRIRTQTPASDEFIWAFRDGRHKDCLSTTWDVLFQRILPGAMGVPPPQTCKHIKRMIPILDGGTPASKGRWIGHPSIPPRVFGPSQYLMMPPVQMTKPKLMSKLLPANSTLKLVPPETQSDAEEH